MSTSPPPAIPEPILINTLRSHRTTINSVAFSPDHPVNQLVSGSDDGSLIFWNLNNSSNTSTTGVCYRLNGHSAAINCVDYSSDGSFFVTAGKDSFVKLWKLNDHQTKPNEEPITYKCHGLNVRHVNINANSSKFCTSSDDKTVKVWDANYRNKFLMTLLGHNNWVRSAKFSPRNNDIIASSGDDCLLLVHDIRTGPRSLPITSISGCKKLSSKLPGPSATHFTCLDWYPSSDFMIAVGSSDSSIRLYDLRNSKMIQFYESHSSPVSSLSFHPSGKYLISSSFDSLVKIYDLMEGRVLFTISAHSGPVRDVKFDPSGDQFISAGNDKVINLWQSNLLNDPETFEEHDTQNQKQPTPLTFSDISPLGPPRVSFERNIPRPSSSDTIPKKNSLKRTEIIRISDDDDDLDTRVSRQSGGDSGRSSNRRSSDSSEDMPPVQGLASRKGRSRTSSTSSSRASSADRRGFREPEHNLLRGIVEQISNLTDAVTLLEQRLRNVEQLVDPDGISIQ